MEKLLSRLLHLCVIGVSVLVMMPVYAGGSPQFPAMFVFGDSLVDDGNNNYLNSFAKANYLPYGIDFFGGPNGRFCNGKTIIDFLGNCIVRLMLFLFSICFFMWNDYLYSIFIAGELLGLPYIPPYVSTIGNDRSVLWGVNFASAGAGILDESGSHLVSCFMFLYLFFFSFTSSMHQADILLAGWLRGTGLAWTSR